MLLARSVCVHSEVATDGCGAGCRQFLVSIIEGDNTGRLLRYDPATRETKVLLRGLRFANGVALSKDGAFLVVCETTVGRCVHTTSSCSLVRFRSSLPLVSTGRRA